MGEGGLTEILSYGILVTVRKALRWEMHKGRCLKTLETESLKHLTSQRQ